MLGTMLGEKTIIRSVKEGEGQLSTWGKKEGEKTVVLEVLGSA